MSDVAKPAVAAFIYGLIVPSQESLCFSIQQVCARHNSLQFSFFEGISFTMKQSYVQSYGETKFRRFASSDIRLWLLNNFPDQGKGGGLLDVPINGADAKEVAQVVLFWLPADVLSVKESIPEITCL
jgi:hypothetical protein